MHNLSYGIQTRRLSGPVAAGVTAVQTPIIDTFGFKCLRLVALVAAVAASGIINVTMQQSDAADMSGSETVQGTVTVTDTGANKLLVLDVHNPRRRYVRFNFERTTANSALDGILAELYNPAHTPVEVHASVAAQLVLSEPAPVVA